MMKLMCIAAIVAALGCGKSADSSGGSGVTTQTAGERCKGAIDNAMEKSKAEISKASPDMAAHVPALAAAMVKHCTEDKWSADATKCLGGAADYAATEACQGMLSGDQLKKLNDEMMTIVKPPSAPPH